MGALARNAVADPFVLRDCLRGAERNDNPGRSWHRILRAHHERSTNVCISSGVSGGGRSAAARLAGGGVSACVAGVRRPER